MFAIKRIIDLSTGLGGATRLFPGTKPISCELHKTHVDEGLQVSRLGITVHSGTHVDSPLHFLEGQGDITTVPLETLSGWARVLDLRHLPPGSGVGTGDLEKACPDLAPGDIAILNTGYEHCGDPAAYCIIEPEGARWLVRRGIKALAMDMLSTDPVKTSPGKAGAHTHPSHHILLGAGIILVECLVNLDALQGDPVFFVCMPLKIEGSEGSPARAAVFEFE
jgi:arylformamidase